MFAGLTGFDWEIWHLRECSSTDMRPVTYVLAAPDPIAAAIDEACRCITAITSRRPLMYGFPKIVFTEMPCDLVSHNVNTGEVLDEPFGAGMDGIGLIVELEGFI